MNSHPVSIDIVSDDIIEPQDESFKITLLFPQGQPFPRVTLDPNVATITISRYVDLSGYSLIF